MSYRLNRVILEVPFREKNEAKALGAWWDPKIKKWYVPEGIDPNAFQKWRTDSTIKSIENNNLKSE